MKRFIIFAILLVFLLSACSGGSSGTTTTEKPVETTKAPESTEPVETTTEAIETTAESSPTKEAVDEYLNGAWDALHENFPDDSFSHEWNDGNLFIEIRTEPVDYFYKNWDSLDEATKAEVVDLAHGYVAGDFAEPLYRGIRERGGDDFTVYFVLVGETVYCTSANLRIIADAFDN